MLKGEVMKDKTKDCACPDSDALTCYFLRYPNQMELDGRDYCECPCHQEYKDADEDDLAEVE